jgi:hypothetical protein
MPLLLYCVAPERVGETHVQGVGEARVTSVENGGLRYFVSDMQGAVPTAEVARAARAVFNVVNDVFSRGPVLPFRYPTVAESVAELEKLAADRGKEFEAFLGRIGSKVQMDVRLTSGEPENSSTSLAKAPGREYLEKRARRHAGLASAAEKCRQQADSAEWRVEEKHANLICHALVERVQVISFQERMSRLDLPFGIKGVVSGPWPPAAFWEEKPR